MDDPVEKFARDLHQALYGRLERRYCTAERPMPESEKEAYMWGHPDAQSRGPFFNLEKFECPHCKLYFTAPPRT